MNEDFDTRLAERINELFDSADDGLANEGWAKLREKYPEKNRKPFLWLGPVSTAALLLFALLTGILLFKQGAGIPKIVGQTGGDGRSSSTQKYRLSRTPLAKGGAVNQKPQLVNTTPKKYLNRPHLAKAASTKSAKGRSIKIAIVDQLMHKPGQANQIEQPAIKATPNAAGNSLFINDMALTAKMMDIETLAANLELNSLKLTAAVPNKQAETLPNAQPAAKAKLTNSSFGVYASSYANNASGSYREFNLGAGFTADRKLYRQFYLSTGVGLSKNSAYYAIGNTAANTILTALAPALPPAAQINTFKANLLAIDVPVNIKYRFLKSHTYIAAGLSSGTFVNEVYQTTYINSFTGTGPLTGQSTSSPLQAAQMQQQFKSFYFGQIVNFSAGIGYPVSKKGTLNIEPFLKYPLKGLGAQQIKYSSGGVSLIYQFNTGKK